MIRELQWKDMGDIISNYYSYYDELKENPDFGIIFFHEKPDYKSEVEWFSSLYKGILEEDAIAVVAEEDGSVVGLCDAHRLRPGSEVSHAAEVGIAIKKGYRGKGLGTALLQKLIDLSNGKFEILKLEVFSVNSSALNLYKSLGFIEYGKMPNAIKRGNRYYDSVCMYYKI